MSKIIVKSGNATIEASPELEEMTNQILRKALPETTKRLEESIERIYNAAKDEWPVRKRIPLTGRQLAFAKAAQLQKRGYDRRAAVAAGFRMLRDGELKNRERLGNVSSISQDSRGKLERGKMIDTQSGEIVAFIKNDAPYAWAIKVGVNSDSILPLGSRVCNELLWKPLRKDATKITRIIAKELTDIIK